MGRYRSAPFGQFVDFPSVGLNGTAPYRRAAEFDQTIEHGLLGSAGVLNWSWQFS